MHRAEDDGHAGRDGLPPGRCGHRRGLGSRRGARGACASSQRSRRRSTSPSRRLRDDRAREPTPVKVLMIDNYDSFTYNLVHLLEELGAEVVTVLNDTITPDEAVALAPTGSWCLPGPGRPGDAGVSIELIRRRADDPDARSASVTRRSWRPSAARSARREPSCTGSRASSPRRRRGLRRPARAGRGRPLPLARRHHGARRPGRDVPNRRRRGDGSPPRRTWSRGPVPGERSPPLGPTMARNFLT